MDLNGVFEPQRVAVIGVSLSSPFHPANIVYNKNYYGYGACLLCIAPGTAAKLIESDIEGGTVMASEREEMLNGEMETFEQELRRLASKLGEISGVDCNFGACVFDPQMNDVEEKIAEVQKRKQILAEVMESLKNCGV
ncbi:MAG: hypothetical protein A2W01_03550 [Candidatus Solincola sediminis]|uniref:Uncharacterized protein n=1 Tax=Candidatus Solincola sediminis TaxID=1797199 RepID=A0A1F2WQR7_9ACTN|nr:MAG: hypothetical protein A2W01_03550 [Candidatus Solincola sediminis]OFW59228.1 MAG: hypothetical protein A2Y75_01765 [Candidatus Solincola sediminis]